MAKHRLLNCEFVGSGAFKVNLSNKGKLLYFLMFASADDKGFVDTTVEIINALEKNDKDLGIDSGLTLLNTDYQSGLDELVEKGYVYEFVDNHNNKIHLIRHWFYHNKLIKGLWTNYGNLLEKVYLKNNEYVLGKKPLKENKLNINQDKLNQDNISYGNEEENQTEPNEDEEWKKSLPFDID